MKKYKLLPLLALTLVSCGGGTTSEESSSVETNQSSSVISSEENFEWGNSDGVVDFSELVGNNSEFNWGDNETSEEVNSSEEIISSEIVNKTQLTYNEKLETFIEDYYAIDQAFYNYIINDKEYKDDDVLASNALFVSPDGEGDGKSIDDPCSIYDALDSMKAGQTVYLRGGTYNLEESIYINKYGTADNYITIRNYPSERPFITSTEENIAQYNENGEYVLFALEKNVAYLKIEGLEFGSISSKSVGGIVCWDGGQDHVIIRNNKFHDLKTTITDMDSKEAEDASANSILLLGEKKDSMNNFLIYGNECYNNVTGWAETISIAGNCEGIYVIENIVRNNTNIGIDFYGNAGYCSTKSLDQPRFCVAALNNVSYSSCDYADCAGLYVDGARDILLTNNISYNNQYGIEIGSEERQDDYPVTNIVCRNNLLYNNSVTGIRVGGYEEKNTGYVKNTKIYNNTIINSNIKDAEGITIAKVDGIDFRNNIVMNKDGYLVNCDFSETYTKNLTFKNNYFKTVGLEESEFEFKMFDKNQTGLDSFNTLVNGNNISGNIEMDLTYNVLSGVTINAGDNSVEVGIYDICFNSRKNGNIDIGCYEY